MTTHDGEILFQISYNGASSYSAGRYSSELMQTTTASQVDVGTPINSQQTKASLIVSYSMMPTKNGYGFYTRPSASPIGTFPPQSNYFSDGYASLNYNDSHKYSVGNKTQKLFNRVSRKFVVWYSLMAKDTGSAQTTYRYWVRSGSPGTVSDYSGYKDGPLTDLAILYKWKVYIE